MRTILLILFLISLKVSGQTINSSQIIFSDLKTCESPSRSAYSSYYKGLEMITNQQWNRAINNFKKAVEKDSTFCGAWAYLSYSYWKNGDLEKSKNNTITSLKINPYNPSALLMKGYQMINNPDLENTQKTFDSVISLVPDAPHGYYGSAISNYLKGNYTTAKKNILKAEEFIDDYFFRPDRKNILTLKGKILFKLNDNEGIKILENNLINMIKDAEANYILGTYYFDLGKPKKASKYINKAHILGYNIDPPLDTLLKN